MKLSSDFVIRKLHGQDYLLPVGQGIVTFQRGIRLNETGVFLCKLLQKDCTRESLIQALAERNKDCGVSLQEIETDITHFLLALTQKNALQTQELAANQFKTVSCYRFGDLIVRNTIPLTYLHESLATFQCAVSQCDKSHCDLGHYDAEYGLQDDFTQEWVLRPIALLPTIHGTRILFNEQLELFDCESSYTFLYPSSRHIKAMCVSRDGLTASFYTDFAKNDDAVEELFFAMRSALFYCAQKQECYALHSASLLYRDMLWLFSAPSGTGKSTHTALWHKLFGTPLINGDINLLAWRGNNITVFGTPWCGTSDIFTKECYPLGGVILLQQSATNFIEKLSVDQQQLLLAQRCISPCWNETQLDQILSFAGNVAHSVPVYRLHCNMQPEAAEIIKCHIDRYLNTAEP